MKQLITRANIQRKHLVYGVVILCALVAGGTWLLNLSPYAAPDINSQNQLVYARALVQSVQDKPNVSGAGQQVASVILLDGPEKSKTVSVGCYDPNFSDASYQHIYPGSEVLLSKDEGNGNNYACIDRYHVPGAAILLVMLLALVVGVAGWRGITAVAGLGVSIAILTLFVVPQIIQGHDAYIACIEGAFIIATTSIYIAHGFTKRTTVAFIGAIGTLGLAVAVTSLSSYLTGLTGFVGEESLGVQYAGQHISLESLLFGGIIIASLGVLNDITIGQAAAIDEIYKANKKQSGWELYRRGMSVGREHIAALVNTLALAYVGVALPAVVTSALYDKAPLLVILNNETVMEEIVRTGVISVSLLLAVPLTTALAAYVLPRWNKKMDTAIKKFFREL